MKLSGILPSNVIECVQALGASARIASRALRFTPPSFGLTVSVILGLTLGRDYFGFAVLRPRYGHLRSYTLGRNSLGLAAYPTPTSGVTWI